MEIRAFRPGDADELGQVFHRAVREGARGAYTEAQVKAWSPKPPSGPGWRDRLEKAHTVVAVDQETLIGFMTLDDSGYIDLAFVRPDHIGQGVGSTLYAVLECKARAHKVPDLSTQASLLAEPFFLRHGWHVTKRQVVKRHGVALQNAWMAKRLTPAAA